MSDWNPNDPPEGAGGTMVAVPRVGAPQPQQQPRPLSFGSMAMPQPQPMPSEAGGTMVGIGRVQIPGAPAPQSQPLAGATMVGIGRVQIGGPPQPAPMPEAGGTMVGIGRVQLPGAMAPAPQPQAGGTMVGIPVARAPMFGGMAMPQPAPALDAGGTMVGIGRVQMPGAPPPMTHAPDAGGTMVGIGRVQMPGAAPAPLPEAGGTMVGMPLVGQGFAAAPPRPTGPPAAYEIVGHLGGGELGQVFHARHRDSGQDVALRIVRPDIAGVPGATDALRDVASLAQNATHTHLGRIFDFDETASPTLVLEYVPGKLLSSVMQERGPAPAAAVIDLAIRLCSALAAAHGAGLAHGRVHAGNVVLEARTGRWVLLDTAHGYCVQGLEPLHDLYALGALLYQMATGQDPFTTDPIQDPRAHVPKLPAALSALLLRTLAPDPGLWFGSAIELAQALARARTMP